MKHPILSILRERKAKIRVHLIGVAGSGMSGLASLLIAQGHQVSGCDRVTTAETERLEKNGLSFNCPQNGEAVSGCDLVIYSSAIRPGNPAYDAAVREGIPLVRRAEALANIMREKDGIVICGTHGKTTTSSLCAHVLRIGGLKPSHYVGAEIPILGTNAFWDEEGTPFVAEGDESDGTLALFHPKHAILLNIEAEHLDYYDSYDQILDVFRTLASQSSSTIVYCGEDAGATQVATERGNALSYGWGEQHDFRAEITQMDPQSSQFHVYKQGEFFGQFTLGIPGKHNILNALGVIALADHQGVDAEWIRKALQSFRGAKRRFDIKFKNEAFTLVDDYGHHPTEIRATLQTARQLNPKRVIVVFQPHRYSRTQLLKKEFGEAFDLADHVIVTDIYPASEKPLPGVTGQTIVDEALAHGHPSCQFVPGLAHARHAAGKLIRPGDLILTLGAGNVHEIGTQLSEDLKLLSELIPLVENTSLPGNVSLYEPMSRHTTMLTGGPAQFWIEPTSADSLREVLKLLHRRGVPVLVIGRGSNLLVRDGGIPGAVIHPVGGEFADIKAEGEILTVAAGVRLKKIASFAQQNGLGGLEWMEGIPGNMGGAVRMNAGAMGKETFDHLLSVCYVTPTGEWVEKPVEALVREYRNAPDFVENILVKCQLKAQRAESEAIAKALDESRQKRRTSQPIAASAGCVFKNPSPETPAGKLVEELGLKKARVGNAEVSEIHGNFIANRGKAPASDILALIQQIKDKALSERGILLETEVQILGQDTPI